VAHLQRNVATKQFYAAMTISLLLHTNVVSQRFLKAPKHQIAAIPLSLFVQGDFFNPATSGLYRAESNS
jgi:hypothetical protein